MRSFDVARALAALLFFFAALTASLPMPTTLPPLRNLPRASKGQIDYTREILEPILCPAAGTGACDAQCGQHAAGLTGKCDQNGNCICADGQGPVRQTGGLHAQS